MALAHWGLKMQRELQIPVGQLACGHLGLRLAAE